MSRENPGALNRLRQAWPTPAARFRVTEERPQVTGPPLDGAPGVSLLADQSQQRSSMWPAVTP